MIFLFPKADKNTSIANDEAELMSTFDIKVPPTPRVVFLDLNMPRKNGFECLQEMKQSEKLKNIPVVIFSTSKEQEHIDKAFHLGAAHYISKLGSYNYLKKVIQQVLEMEWKQKCLNTLW